MSFNRTIAIFFIAFVSLASNSQLTERIESECLEDIGSDFVHNSQPMRALLTGSEIAEFRTTLFEGNIYRFVACSPGNNNIWFSVYDANHKLLFSSSHYDNPKSWDFKLEGNMECIIEAGLLPGSGDSGLALMLIGFKNASEM